MCWDQYLHWLPWRTQMFVSNLTDIRYRCISFTKSTLGNTVWRYLWNPVLIQMQLLQDVKPCKVKEIQDNAYTCMWCSILQEFQHLGLYEKLARFSFTKSLAATCKIFILWNIWCNKLARFSFCRKAGAKNLLDFIL